MSKISSQNQQSFFKRLWNSKPFWTSVVVCGVIILCLLLAIGIHTGKDSSPLQTAYDEFPSLKSWSLTNIEKHTEPSCNFSDVTCPDISATYDVSQSNNLATDIASIHDTYAREGYNFTKKCYAYTSTCRVIGVVGNNGKVQITVWVVNSNNPLKSYVEFQKAD